VTEPSTYTNWHKSPRSGGGDHCVEVAFTTDGGTVGVRDSKNRTGPILEFAPESWAVFTQGVRDGEFDA
jgi:hypothetical protein